MISQERATLGDLHVITHVWEFGDEPDSQSCIFAPKPGVPSNLVPIVHLDDYDPADLRKFATALNDVANEIERRRTPYDEDGEQ